MIAVDQKQLDAWLARLGGPGFKGDDDREQAVAEMRAAGKQMLFPLLIPMLSAELESRCKACKAILLVEPEQGLELVLPLLRDTDSCVRWYACTNIAQYGGARTARVLREILQSDDDAQVRGTAAAGLGKHGGPEDIPLLLQVMAQDHEKDTHGHSPSHCAAMALDDILGTDETCLHLGTVCRMLDRSPDLDRLRHLAEERYQRWVSEREQE